MNLLHDALFTYAIEERMPLFLHPYQHDETDNLNMVERSLNYLKALGPDAAEHAKRVQNGLDTVQYLNTRAAFLAGLSIGLELGALGHGT